MLSLFVAALLGGPVIGPGAAHGFPAVEVYRTASKSVVLIVAGGKGSSDLVGAGSVVAEGGLIVTNAHVVVDSGTGRPYPKLLVFVKPGEVTGNLAKDLADRHEAEVVAYDPKLDLALVRARDFPSGVRPVMLADPGEIMVGEEVVAIGHPEQGGLWSLTYGRISGQIAGQSNVRGKDVYQTDTSVNRGNSGGPLLDRRGYLVGVNTNIARRGADDIAITGVNFALKSSVVRKWAGKQGLALAYGKEPLSTVPAEGEKAVAAPGQIPETVQAPKGEQAPETEHAQAKDSPIAAPEKKAAEAGAKSDLKGVEEELAEAETRELESDTLLTPERPYSEDELFSAVEREMEGVMEEMKMKIRKQNAPLK